MTFDIPYSALAQGTLDTNVSFYLRFFGERSSSLSLDVTISDMHPVLTPQEATAAVNIPLTAVDDPLTLVTQAAQPAIVATENEDRVVSLSWLSVSDPDGEHETYEVFAEVVSSEEKLCIGECNATGPGAYVGQQLPLGRLTGPGTLAAPALSDLHYFWASDAPTGTGKIIITVRSVQHPESAAQVEVLLTVTPVDDPPAAVLPGARIEAGTYTAVLAPLELPEGGTVNLLEGVSFVDPDSTVVNVTAEIMSSGWLLAGMCTVEGCDGTERIATVSASTSTGVDAPYVSICVSLRHEAGVFFVDSERMLENHKG